MVGTANGLVFLRTKNLQRITDFYMKAVGMHLFHSQAGIKILISGNFLVGFQQSAVIDTDTLLTFFYSSTEEVDEMHRLLSPSQQNPRSPPEFLYGASVISAPKHNPKFNIYNFSAKDPDGRKIEFQMFMHVLKEVSYYHLKKNTL